jgi:hypothetical protein
MSVGFAKRPEQPLDSGIPRKVYVTSGELRWCGIATGCLDAIKRALEKYGSGKTLDSSYFFVDERGFRIDEDAAMKVTVEEGLRAAGYVFDNPHDAID